VLKTALRSILGHRFRLLSTGLAVALGVAFLAGTLALNDTLRRTFDDLWADVYENTDAVVRAEAAFESPEGLGDERGRIDATLTDTVQRVDGVAATQGDVFGYAQLVGRDGDPIGDPVNGAPTVGTNWAEIEDLNPWDLVAGREPRADDEVVIVKASADEAGYAVGDSATVLTKVGPQEVRIVGVTRFGSADSPGGASFTIFTMAAAQRLLGEPGRFDSISVMADDGVTERELTGRLRDVLPGGVEAVTGTVITEENQDVFHDLLSVFNTFMLVFAFIALFVGGFMIFNTFFITVAQRTRENALLRAVGASKRQVLGSVLLEALAVGVVASFVGVAAGVAVAAGLKALLAGFGMDVPSTGVVFTARTALLSLGAGVVITLVSAVSPARKAGKVPPVAAMREVSGSSTGYGSKERIMIGGALLAAGVGLLLWGLFGAAGSALALVGLGVLVLFFGVSVLGRTIALPLSRAIGAPLPKVRGITGELARENAMRNPKRTAAAASALMIGVGVVSLVTIFAASTKSSVEHAVDEALVGDLVVTGAGGGFGGIDPAVGRRIDGLPEVGSAVGFRTTSIEVDGNATAVVAADPARAFDLVDFDPVAGAPGRLGEDAIAVHRDEAAERGVEVGDTVPVVFRDTGRQDLRVGLIYGNDELLWEGEWFLGLAAFEANVTDQADWEVFVEGAAGVPLERTRAAVESVVAGYPGVEVQDQQEFGADQTAQVDQMLGLVYALLALAIVIALLGIGNTLALSILERTRELGVMRAVGMTRRQLRSAIRWESVIIALQGTALGLVVGIFVGWALVRALAGEGLTVFALPVPSLVVIVVLAALAGVLAAVLPARRAAHLNVLGALTHE
jgi:putative ABC transport system permease protein